MFMMRRILADTSILIAGCGSRTGAFFELKYERFFGGSRRKSSIVVGGSQALRGNAQCRDAIYRVSTASCQEAE